MSRRTILAIALGLGLVPAPAFAQARSVYYSGLPRFQVSAIGGLGRSFDGNVGVQRLGLGLSYRFSHRFGAELDGLVTWLQEPSSSGGDRVGFAGLGATANVDLGGSSESVRFGLYGGASLVGRFDDQTAATTAHSILSGLVGFELRAGWPCFAFSIRAGAEFNANLAGDAPLGGVLATEMRIGIGTGRVPSLPEARAEDGEPAAATTLRQHICTDLRADLPSDMTGFCDHREEDAASSLPVCRATFPTDWGLVTVSPMGESCSTTDVDTVRAPINPHSCAMVVAQATASHPVQDLDLRLVDAAGVELLSDTATDDWPVIIACNFSDNPMPFGQLHGRYASAPSNVIEGYATITRINLSPPTLLAPAAPLAAASDPALPALASAAPFQVRDCVGSRLDDQACGFTLSSTGDRQFTVPGGELCYVASALSGITFSYSSAGVANGPSIPLRNGGWGTLTCQRLPEDQGEWRVTVHLGDTVGGPVMISHARSSVDRELRLREAMGGALRRRDDSEVAPMTFGLATTDQPLRIENISVPRFATLEVRAVTERDDVGPLSFSIRDRSRELASGRAETHGVALPASMNWLNVGEAASVSASVAPNTRDRVALHARLHLPAWQRDNGTVGPTREALNNVSVCSEAMLNTAPGSPGSLSAGAMCRLESTTPPTPLRVAVGTTLCFASESAPKLKHLGREFRDAQHVHLGTVVPASAPCESIQRPNGQASGDVTLEVSSPTLVYRP